MFALIISYRRLYLFSLLGACLLSACSSSRQRESKLSLNNAPEIRGLRLGMTLEEFEARFPATEKSPFSTRPTELKPDKDGVIVMSGIDAHNSNDRAHVEQLLLVDGRVAHFRVVYENYTDQFVWEDVDQFAGKMSESLGLPDSWQSRDFLHLESNRELYLAWDLLRSSAHIYTSYWGVGNLEQMFLLCGDTLVSAGVPSPGKRHWTNGAFIQFDDLVALRVLRTRMENRRFEDEQKKEKRREEFKP